MLPGGHCSEDVEIRTMGEQDSGAVGSTRVVDTVIASR
jgi:hypothetical protein